jgi:outer membrane protein
MPNSSRLRILILLLVSAGPSGAARPAEARPSLSMEQAVQQALARAPELSASREAANGAADRLQQAKTTYLPRLSAEVSYLARWPASELPIQLPPTMPPIGPIDDVHHFRAGAALGLRLLDLSRGPRVDAARSSLEGERAKTRETEAALAFQVRASFLSALFSRDLKRIAAESLKLASAEEKRAQLRAEVGTGSKLALAQARVRVAGLRAQLRQAESELERHRQNLASLLGVGDLPELRGDLSALVGSVRERGLSTTPSLARLRASRQSAEQMALGTARSFLPTLSLLARAEVEYPHNMRTEWGPLIQGGASLTWDFFDGGLRRSQEREARAQARSLEELTRATEQSLRRKLIDLEARGRTARADLLSARDTLEQTEVYLRVARATLAAGTGTELDVHNAELGLDQARIAVQRALFAQALVRAEVLLVHGAALDRSGGER